MIGMTLEPHTDINWLAFHTYNALPQPVLIILPQQSERPSRSDAHVLVDAMLERHRAQAESKMLIRQVFSPSAEPIPLANETLTAEYVFANFPS